MDKKLLKKEYYMDVLDEYLGELIEEIVIRYYEDKIDVDEEYLDILEFIADRLMNSESGSSTGFEKKVSRLSRNPSLARVIVSYLVSKYVEEREGSVED